MNIKTLRERGKYNDRYRMVFGPDDKLEDFELIEKNCNVKHKGPENDKASPMSTATTDNYPTEDNLGKRTTQQANLEPLDGEQSNKRQKTNNEHCPLEID